MIVPISGIGIAGSVLGDAQLYCSFRQVLGTLPATARLCECAAGRGGEVFEVTHAVGRLLLAPKPRLNCFRIPRSRLSGPMASVRGRSIFRDILAAANGIRPVEELLNGIADGVAHPKLDLAIEVLEDIDAYAPKLLDYGKLSTGAETPYGKRSIQGSPSRPPSAPLPIPAHRSTDVHSCSL